MKELALFIFNTRKDGDWDATTKGCYGASLELKAYPWNSRT